MNGLLTFFSIRNWVEWKRRSAGSCRRLQRCESLFYEFYVKTRVGGKWFCVVVKYPADDAFVVTAYLTDQLKPGESLWPKK
jgi:hypothetical protein